MKTGLFIFVNFDFLIDTGTETMEVNLFTIQYFLFCFVYSGCDICATQFLEQKLKYAYTTDVTSL